MPFIKKYWDWIVIGILILIFTILLSELSLLRHDSFASGFDLGNMDQTVWNTLHGNLFNLTGEKGTVSRFSIHADLILILLAPLYLIWNNVRTLMISDALFIYDFHPVALSIPYLITAFYAYTKKWRLYWLFAFLALMTKEEVSLQVTMLGVYIFFFH